MHKILCNNYDQEKEIHLVTDDEGVPLSSDLYKVAIPPTPISILLDYVENSGITKDVLLNAQCDGMFTDTPESSACGLVTF